MIKKDTLLIAAGFVLLWNSGFIGAEYGLPYAGPFTLLFWRYLAPLGSVIGITVATLLQRRMELKKERLTLAVDQALFYQSLATMLALALPAIFIEKLSTQWKPEFIYAMIWLVLAVSLGAYGLMWLLIERINATRVAGLFYLGPPVTMFMAWIAFGDQIRVMDVVGLVVVFAGVSLTLFKPEDSG